MKKIAKSIVTLGLVLVAVFAVASCDKNKMTGEKGHYTYNTSISVFPTTWNVHQYKTATDAVILDYTTAGLYTFDVNEAKNGYKIVKDMAASEPEDVTSQYVGQYGIEEGDTAKAYKIQLRNDLRWEDGTAIHAADFVESVKLLLDPVAKNYRADSLYTSSLIIKNAESYYKQGSHDAQGTIIETGAPTEYHAYLGKDEAGNYTFDGLKIEDGKYWINKEANEDLLCTVENSGLWSSSPLTKYASAGYLYKTNADGEYLDKDGNVVAKDASPDEEGNFTKYSNEAIARFAYIDAYQTLLDAQKYGQKDEKGESIQLDYIVVTPTIAKALADICAWLNADGTTEDYVAALTAAGRNPNYAYEEWQEFCFKGGDYAAVSFDSVGFKATAENELTIILDKALSGFYLNYSLCTDFFLVNVDLYKRCATTTSTGVYNNTYGTSVDTYMSYGPYKLVEFQNDKVIKFAKNDQWYGHGEGVYQTTDVQIDYVAEASTRLELFNAGRLDTYGLTADDMSTYASSDYTYYEKGASTFYMAFNPSETNYAKYDEEHAGECKSVINNKNFRMAFSFGIDRAQFCLAADPLSSGAFGMFSDLIVSDPDNGVAYRTTDAAKQVLVEFWGLADDIGAGKRYATVDDAINSITGYDLAASKEHFNLAYQEAVEAGIMGEGDVVKFIVGIPRQAPFYSKGYEFIKNAITIATEGTSFEGKIEFSVDDTLGNQFRDALNKNKVDFLFGVGWQGAALDPYNLIGAYTMPSYQYDNAWNTKNEMITVSLPVKAYTTDVEDPVTHEVSPVSGYMVDPEGTENWDLTASLYAWSAEALIGTSIDAIKKADSEEGEDVTVKCEAGTSQANAIRVAIFAACEKALLLQYDLIPLIDDSSANLKGMQIKYGWENYIFGVGRGGLKYMTYNYDDYDWAEFVNSQKGSLNYK